MLSIVVIGAAWAVLRHPAAVPPKEITVLSTPERIERGQYLFEHLSDCSGCHSDRDFSRLGGPVKPGGIGVGMVMPDEMGLPGVVVAPNITPDPETGLGKWTDGEIIRAIREGVDRDGNALFPFMPYQHFRHMSDEDVEALVAYMRKLTPVRHPLPRTELALPVALMIKSAPQPVTGEVKSPSRSDGLAYGKYLVEIAGCAGCHTVQEHGQPVASMEFAGGFEFRMPQGTVLSSNITPDVETGIGSWTEDGFVSRFRQYSEYAEGGGSPVSAETFTLMPWLAYSKLTDEDLRVIYEYLRTVKPVSHKVQTHPGAAAPQR
ncbi:MAG: c-type cytochrome [Bryobacterales bacterium]|nr:c-type cytochrome [Bryobacterales bacterium]